MTQPFENCRNKIESRLEELLQGEGTLEEGMRYAVSGGKKIRPILLLKSYEMIAKQPALPILDFACALEMIHGYSLVHDDLPCMDDDLKRRGKPSVYGKFGEESALLIGDALLTKAFAVMADAVAKDDSPVNLKNRAQAMSEIAMRAGHTEMILGQVLDVEGETMDVDTLHTMVDKKTAALLKAAVGAGAKLAGATPKQYDAVVAYAENLGFAFQAKDDMFDREKDEKLQKQTLVTGLTDAEAQQYVDEKTDAAIHALDGMTDTEQLIDMAHLLVHRTI